MNDLFIRLLPPVIGSAIGAVISFLIKEWLERHQQENYQVESRRALSALALGIVIGGIVGYAVGQFIPFPSPICQPETPVGATMVDQILVSVPAEKYWSSTGVNVKKGDWLHFTAEGEWWNGISQTDADGDKGWPFGIGRPSCGQCPVVGGNLGELVGKMEGGLLFRIGRCRTEIIQRDGTLLLAMNENTGKCKSGGEGSCYDDNKGTLNVKITIWRIK